MGTPTDDGGLIRVAERRDVPSVLALWDAARSSAASTPDDEESVERLIAHSGGTLLIAEDQGRVVGALVVGWDGWRGNMYRLAVLPEHRRLGIARRLVEAGHEHLRTSGVRRVTALVAHADDDATGFWATIGYSHHEEMSRYVTNL